MSETREIKIGDLVWIKHTGEGPFLVFDKWTKCIDTTKNNAEITDQPCLVLANVDARPLIREQSGHWLGNTAKNPKCSAILEVVCTTEQPVKEPTKFEILVDKALHNVASNFGLYSMLSIIVFSIAAIFVVQKTL